MFCIFTYCDILRYVTLTFWNDYVLKLLRTVMLLRYVTPPFWNDYVLKLLHLETLTFRDATLSDINVVWCYVLSQNPKNCFFVSFQMVSCDISKALAWGKVSQFSLHMGFKMNFMFLASKKMLLFYFILCLSLEKTHFFQPKVLKSSLSPLNSFCVTRGIKSNSYLQPPSLFYIPFSHPRAHAIAAYHFWPLIGGQNRSSSKVETDLQPSPFISTPPPPKNRGGKYECSEKYLFNQSGKNTFVARTCYILTLSCLRDNKVQ